MKASPQPPRLAQRILKVFAGRAEIEDLQGDLDELFLDIHLKQGKIKAKAFYWLHTISLLFSYGLKKRKSKSAYSAYYSNNTMAMFKNYFKIAIRNFSKHKLFTALNIFGLALGMSLCLLALSMAVAIYSSDSFHEHKDRIFQVNTEISDEENSRTLGSTFYAVGNYLEQYPFIEKILKIQSTFSPEINHHGNLMSFHGYYADPSFFDVFSFEMISGNPHSALENPFSIILTESIAQRLFKDENPIGKVLKTKEGDYTVTGVMKDLKQTHLYFEVLTSYSTFTHLSNELNLTNNWEVHRGNYVYVLLKEGIGSDQLTAAINQMSNVANDFHHENTIAFEIIDLVNVVPRWNLLNALGIGWDQPSIIFFLFIGFLVLLPAIFNYTNLSIARALKRAKEIGVRKVVGAQKFQIKAQFIIETMILTLLALLGSIVIFLPIKQEFLSMVRAAEVLDTSMRPSQITVFIIFTLLIGYIAGIFPAKFFSKLNPIHTMKGDINNGKVDVSSFKKGLFVFQFFLSLVFIIGVATIARQYSYVLNANHGFESENILTVPFNDIDKQIALNELANHPDVKSITAASHLPGIVISSSAEVTSNDLDTILVNEVFIGPNFIKNMNMKLVWGESESIKRSNKSEELVLVNQQFLQSIAVFNAQKDSLTFTLSDGTQCRIIGVMEDANYEPMTQSIDPLVFRYSLDRSNYALLTINSKDIKKTINELDQIWSNINQNTRFESSFLEEEIEDAYYLLMAQIKFFTVLSTLAITISCLGLLGMVSYTTENRTKEIAVRKIMGASNRSLYYLLTKDFLKLILISALLAVPFSYFFYDKLFLYLLIRYGLGLGAGEILVSILFLFLVGFVSIYWQTSKVAHANPAGNLRYE